MNKLGLKLWSTNTDNYINPAKDLYDKGKFDFIELYIVPDTINYIEIWKTVNIPFNVHMAHSAHNVDLSRFEKRNYNKKTFDEAKKYADSLNAEKIIIHGGTGGDYKECAEQIKIFNDDRIHIENKPHVTLPFVKADVYTGSTIEEIQYIMDRCGCSFCLDIGHAICSANSHGFKPYTYIRDFMNLVPSCVHISDININTEIDEHLNFGSGKLDFNRIINILDDHVPIVIETNKKSKVNLDDFAADANYLKKIFNKGII